MNNRNLPKSFPKIEHLSLIYQNPILLILHHRPSRNPQKHLSTSSKPRILSKCLPIRNMSLEPTRYHLTFFQIGEFEMIRDDDFLKVWIFLNLEIILNVLEMDLDNAIVVCDRRCVRSRRKDFLHQLLSFGGVVLLSC